MAKFQSVEELRGLSESDLRAVCLDIDKQLFELRNQRARDGRLANPAGARLMRRHKARVLAALAHNASAKA
jgi:ribosomal protein L29